jgi:hypothetical protein
MGRKKEHEKDENLFCMNDLREFREYLSLGTWKPSEERDSGMCKLLAY